MLYLRRLLRVSWLTDSWPFDTATTGSSISFELHREEADGSYLQAFTVYGGEDKAPASVHYNHGLVLDKLGDASRALQSYRLAAKLDPTDAAICIRIRTSKLEYMIVPEAEFGLIVLQQPNSEE